MIASPCKNSPAAHHGDQSLDLVTIPAGEFTMGGIHEDKFVSAVELPRQRITIGKAFAMAKTCVTQGQWQAVMDLPGQAFTAALPVVNVSYLDVQTFLGRLSQKEDRPYRLPSEAEWEYACRAGSSTIFPQGSQFTLSEANFLYDERGVSIGPGRRTPVDHYPVNAFGLHDLLGNVCEWTADVWHPNHTDAPRDGSPRTQSPKPGCRTIRGGAWDHLPRVLRPSWRDWAPENARWDNLGFRLACDLEHTL